MCFNPPSKQNQLRSEELFANFNVYPEQKIQDEHCVKALAVRAARDLAVYEDLVILAGPHAGPAGAYPIPATIIVGNRKLAVSPPGLIGPLPASIAGPVARNALLTP